jgi:hypothetical protein
MKHPRPLLWPLSPIKFTVRLNKWARGSHGIRWMQQRSLQQVRVSVSLIFLIHGLIIATWASRIPAFQARLHISPAVLGRSLMMAAIGSVLAMPASGWLINKSVEEEFGRGGGDRTQHPWCSEFDESGCALLSTPVDGGRRRFQPLPLKMVRAWHKP